MYHLEDPIDSVTGIGAKLSQAYERMDVRTVRDLLFYVPRTHIIYPKPILEPHGDYKETPVALKVRVTESAENKKARIPITLLYAFAGEMSIEMIWFRSQYIKKQLAVGHTYIFYGKLSHIHDHKYKMEQPAVITEADYEELMSCMQPVYSLTRGMTSNKIKKSVAEALAHTKIDEYLPERLLKKRGLMGIKDALEHIHFPDDMEELKTARDRLVYDELLYFFFLSRMAREGVSAVKNQFDLSKHECVDKVREGLPFELTAGQDSAIKDCFNDFLGEHVTQRLIQGDVGCGKTIIAFLCMTLFVENGYQAAIMAPTEILAGQHKKTFESYIDQFDLPYRVVFLTGSMSAKEKRDAYEVMSSDEPCYIVGTHALFQKKPEYGRLGLVITDEQHRFGVKQRNDLSLKGEDPFVMVMSATPIPRTLSMILYGDMLISVISDVPSDRVPRKNEVIDDSRRGWAYGVIRDEVKKGHQAYVICPLVEESEKTEAADVKTYSDAIRDFYKGAVSVGMLHGRMTPDEKDKVMQDFLEKKIDVLVSTTVVEVGVNIKNATVMLVEDANRFGLAQLHQLRGRIGRGDAPSLCIFVDKKKDGKESKRLKILAESNDGFYIANEDLKLRGPGDFFGIRQSGDFSFRIADIYQDADMLKAASEDVNAIFETDPHFTDPANARLSEFMTHEQRMLYANL